MPENEQVEQEKKNATKSGGENITLLCPLTGNPMMPMECMTLLTCCRMSSICSSAPYRESKCSQYVDKRI